MSRGRSSSSGVSGDGVAGNNIAFIGDSRSRYGRRAWFKNGGTSDSKGLIADWHGCGSGVTSDGTGTVEYRASDASLRWTAPGDTAGPWTPMVVGVMVLQSGAADKWLRLVLISRDTRPSTDQTVSISVSGQMYQIVDWTGHATQVMSRYRNGPAAYYLGAGGAGTAHLAEMAVWYSRTIVGRGIDVIRIGTNDITGEVRTAAEMIAATTALADARVALGRRVVIVGETARWGINTSTAMTAGQLATLIAYNKGLAAWCAANSGVARYVDAYSITRDATAVDGRPAAGMLVDRVHDAPLGAVAVGNAVVAAIQSLGELLQVDPYPQPGDAAVVFNSSSTWMHLTGGTTGTGASGTLPGGITAGRASGSDLTAVCSVETYSDQIARLARLDLTSTTANNIFEVNSTLPSGGPSPATLGLAVGDQVYFDVDVEVVSGAPTAIDVFLNFVGSGRRAQITVPGVPGVYHQRSDPITVLAADTAMRQMTYITMPAAATASVRRGHFVTRKV